MSDTIENMGSKFAKMWGRIRMAHEAVMVEDVRNVLHNDRKTVRNYQDAMLNNKQPSKDDEMGDLYLGDVTITRPQQQSGLAKALLGIGLLATGAGLPVGGYLIADAIKNRPVPDNSIPAPVTTSIDTDTDSVIQWVLE